MIATAADKLWKELTGNIKNLNVTAVQLGFTGIETTEAGQQSIEGFFKPREATESHLKRARRDSNTVQLEVDPPQLPETPGSTSLASFICERCNKRISTDESNVDQAEVDRTTALAKLRMEHDDFHFAQDLANGSDGPSQPSTPKRKKTAEPKGIAKFFIKK